MAEDLTENAYLQACEAMSADELSEYIDTNLDKQVFWRKNPEPIPCKSETYDELIRILSKKLDAKSKEIAARTVSVTRRQRDRDKRKSEANVIITRLVEKKNKVFEKPGQFVEIAYLSVCERMSTDELSGYIAENLDKQMFWQKSPESIPYESQTYDELIKLLSRKLDARNKEIESAALKTGATAGEVLGESNYKASSPTANLVGKKNRVFEKREKLAELSLRLTKSFNRLNHSKIRTSEIARIIDSAVSFQNLVEPEIVWQKASYRICAPFLLYDICRFVSSYDAGKFGRDLQLALISATEAWHRFQPNQQKAWDIEERKEQFRKGLEKPEIMKEVLQHLKAFTSYFLNDEQLGFNESNQDAPIKTEYLSWEILPSGEATFIELIRHFRQLSKTSAWSARILDEERLERIKMYLRPNKQYLGHRGFEGYVLFTFEWTDKAVLDCPFYGNAIYIIKDNWKDIARLSKPEAKYLHSNRVTTINHTDTWFGRLTRELRGRE